MEVLLIIGTLTVFIMFVREVGRWYWRNYPSSRRQLEACNRERELIEHRDRETMRRLEEIFRERARNEGNEPTR